MSPAPVRGVVQAQICPYTTDDRIDHDGLAANTKRFVSYATDRTGDFGLLANGSTAESYANSTEEKKAVIQTVVDNSGSVPVVAGTGSSGTKMTIEMTKYAQQAGADAALVVTPYYRSPTESGLYDHFEAVSDATDIDIIVYNNPDVSGAWIPPAVLRQISELDSVVATKDGTPTIGDYYALTRELSARQMSILASGGYTTYVAKSSMSNVCAGFFSIIANFAPAIAYDLYEAVTSGSEEEIADALALQDEFWSFIGDVEDRRNPTTVLPHGWSTNHLYLPVTKAAMDLVGLHGGHCRLPEVDLTADEVDELRQILERMGVETVD